MVRKTITFLFPFYLIFVLLTSCDITGKNRKKPASTGQPYEVVLEGDTDSIVTKMLTEDVTGLPQPEPLCRLIQVKKGKTQGNYLLVRTRIVVNIGERDFSVRLSHNENAAPQNIIRITARSAQQLQERLNGERLRQIVDEVELKHLADIISSNPSKQNKEMQDEIKKMFGIDMKIPVSMNASKKAKDFIWISNNASTGMQNLLVFKVKSEERRMKNSNAFYVNDKAQIDSILRTNMLGETDSMYCLLEIWIQVAGIYAAVASYAAIFAGWFREFHRFDRTRLVADVFVDAFNLWCIYEGTLYTHRFVAVEIEHITTTDELVGSRSVEDGLGL